MSHGFNAVLLALGERGKAQASTLGLAPAATGIQASPDTAQTSLAHVFAAGAVVKPVTQVVRAMAEGLAAAGFIDQFLRGQNIGRARKIFSSVMGKVEKDEAALFLGGLEQHRCGGGLNRAITASSPCHASSMANRAPEGQESGRAPDDARDGSPDPVDASRQACQGIVDPATGAEAARCLHCDCRAAGNCSLQQYAENYGPDPGRFRQQRRRFELHRRPGGILFEPGKCILCGICVNIAKRAAEPLGLTFIGRGFDVRVGAPMNREFAEGLQRVAAECAECCPTGAIVLAAESPETSAGR
jgi:ferredoxin